VSTVRERVRLIRGDREETYLVAEELPDGTLVLRPEPAATAPAATAPEPESPEPEIPRDVLTDEARAPVAQDAILEIEGLTVAYGAKVAVSEVSFQIRRGEIFGLLGPNGAGKTSTLSAIEGLVNPRSGTVLLDGLDVRRHPAQTKSRMGVQLQATSFQSELTIRQIIRLYGGLYGVRLSADEIERRLRDVGLHEEADKPFKQLSGGQQQRLALQIAIVHDPDLLLLDEPTAGLDPQSRRQLWGRIEHLRHEGGSILLTTHSMEEAQAVCDRVAIIDHGELLTAETPRDLIAKHQDDPRVREVAHGQVTLEDVFIGLTGSEIRD
jgi:ABC-2 type transport system ATP-binding protein